jgi:hypothetical protein
MVKIPENAIRTWLSVFLLFFTGLLFGQAQAPPSARLIEFRYGFQTPLADMKKRFGGNNIIGFGMENIRHNSRIFYGLEANYFFGSRVKEDVLTQLRSYDGNIIGIGGETGDVNLKERGFFVGLYAGKIFPTTNMKTSLTGIRTQLGFGLMQHKIRVQDNLNSVVALNKEYLQGYDRLTNGPAIRFALGYEYDNPQNNFHFRIMADMIAGYTQSRRDLDYATGTYLDEKRTDILMGLNIAYVVMISRAQTPENIYY